MDNDRILDNDGKLKNDYNDIIIQGDAPPAINYHRIVGEDVDPGPAVTYASFNCPRGVFKVGITCCVEIVRGSLNIAPVASGYAGLLRGQKSI